MSIVAFQGQSMMNNTLNAGTPAETTIYAMLDEGGTQNVNQVLLVVERYESGTVTLRNVNYKAINHHTGQGGYQLNEHRSNEYKIIDEHGSLFSFNSKTPFHNYVIRTRLWGDVVEIMRNERILFKKGNSSVGRQENLLYTIEIPTMIINPIAQRGSKVEIRHEPGIDIKERASDGQIILYARSDKIVDANLSQYFIEDEEKNWYRFENFKHEYKQTGGVHTTLRDKIRVYRQKSGYGKELIFAQY
jgi:hypothetical protein